MNRILNFLREKSFVFILLACIGAAAGTSIWAIDTVRDSLNEGLKPNSTQQGTLPEALEQPQGDDTWNQPTDKVVGDKNGEISMEEDGAPAQSAAQSASSSSSGSASSPEPSATPEPSEEPAQAALPSLIQPVSGLVMNGYSGDELVYNETLCDWRTHNGIDYAAEQGEAVVSPIDATVRAIETDGNWGGVVELMDAQGNVWRFCGVEATNLAVDTTVHASQEIGKIGIISAESAAPPHLHLEILKDGKYQNPAEYLK